MHLFALAALSAVLVSCSKDPDKPPAGTAEGQAAPRPAGDPAPAREEPEGISYVEVEGEAGVAWRHYHGGSGKKYMIETMGSGGGVLDYDGDGFDDIFLVQGGALPGFTPPGPMENGLFRNEGNGRFRDVTQSASVHTPNYGMGFCSADYDNDGDADIYVTALDENALLSNDGDGTFTDRTVQAGVGDSLWGSSCAFADVNGDGAVDLYVLNYVLATLENHKTCGNAELKRVSYCHPDVYDGVSGVLYLNNMDGTFSDVSRESGIYNDLGKGLGVVFTDYDLDGDQDLYVANDSVANFLFENDGHGRFTEEGLFAGVAYNENGETQAGMGVDAGDVDGDGDMDYIVTHLDSETNALYRNLGDTTFSDDSFISGIGEPSIMFVGFGTNFLDFDNDGDVDVFVANGHILDDVAQYNESMSYAQRAHLLVNSGDGSFRERGAEYGPFFATQGVARGSATTDMDHDGDLDLVISYNNAEAKLVRNEGRGHGHWLQVKAVGHDSNRDAIGAHLTLSAGGRKQVREVRAGSSYLSQSSLVVHFGLGETALIDSLQIRWPSGTTKEYSGIETDRIVVVDESRGILSP